MTTYQYTEGDGRVVEYTEEQVAQIDSMIRSYRNRLLSETDFWSVSDRPAMTDAQRAYRQALRDLPTNANWPLLYPEDWPVKP